MKCPHGRLKHPTGNRKCKKKRGGYRSRRSTGGSTKLGRAMSQCKGDPNFKRCVNVEMGFGRR